MNYRNEAAFSTAIVNALRSKSWFVQRIESGAMGKGIPDIYAISPKGIPYWLELKRIHAKLSPLFTVPWRPGQQAWMYKVSAYKQKCYTIIAFDDSIILLRNDTLYRDNVVNTYERASYLCRKPSDAVSALEEKAI